MFVYLFIYKQLYLNIYFSNLNCILYVSFILYFLYSPLLDVV